jgi:hypothetical protein
VVPRASTCEFLQSVHLLAVAGLVVRMEDVRTTHAFVLDRADDRAVEVQGGGEGDTVVGLSSL